MTRLALNLYVYVVLMIVLQLITLCTGWVPLLLVDIYDEIVITFYDPYLMRVDINPCWCVVCSDNFAGYR